MTSQVALLNRTGVAIASDSISTLISGDGSKPLSNTQKVFEIGLGHKVLIMNQGDSSISGVPVQTLIAKWAQSLEAPKETTFNYLESFLDFLETLDMKSIPEMQEHFKNFMYSQLRKISESVSDYFDGEKPWWDSTKEKFAKDPNYLKRYRTRVSLEVASYFKELNENKRWGIVDDAKNQTEELKAAAARGAVSEMVDLWFPDECCPISTKLRLKNNMYLALERAPFLTDDCHLAFVGFGSADLFPSVYSLGIEDVYFGIVRWRGLNSANSQATKTGIIYRLAQTDTIDGFLNGFHPTFLDDLKSGMAQAMVDERTDDFDDPSEFSEPEQEIWRGIGMNVFNKLLTTINNYSSKHKSVLEATLGFMEMSELSKVARSLVELQILGTLNDTETPSVGGEVIVATITLSNGVAWGRRV